LCTNILKADNNEKGTMTLVTTTFKSVALTTIMTSLLTVILVIMIIIIDCHIVAMTWWRAARICRIAWV